MGFLEMTLLRLHVICGFGDKLTVRDRTIGSRRKIRLIPAASFLAAHHRRSFHRPCSRSRATFYQYDSAL